MIDFQDSAHSPTTTRTRYQVTEDGKVTVLVISEFFLPIENPATNRVVSWCRHLGKFGIYPVIFTLSRYGVYYNEFHNDYEVHFFPFRDSFFERVAQWFEKNEFVVLRRLARLLDFIFTDYSWYNPIKVIKSDAAIEIAEEKQPACILATAPGHSSFGVANSLATKLNLQWIADYRDDWTTNLVSRSFKASLRLKDRFYEKWLLSKSSGFTSVSDHYVKTIGKLIKKPGWLVENGFEPDDVPVALIESEPRDNSKIVFVYPGRLYKSQRLDLLGLCIDALDEESRKDLNIIFLGSNIHKDQFPKQVHPFLGSTIQNLPWMSQKKALACMGRADAFLYVAYVTSSGQLIKGVPGSKLYHYIMLRKPVLMLPSDHDIAMKKLTETGQAVDIQTPRDFVSFVSQLRKKKQEETSLEEIIINADAYYSNTREAQARKLARVILRIICERS